MNLYVASDFHRDLTMLKQFCKENHTTKEDILLHAGDLQINYLGYSWDREIKRKIAQLPITICNIRGNHEMKPGLLLYYDLVDWHGGKAYMEKEYDNIICAKDGEVYDFNGLSVIAIGGAYSPNKHHLVYTGQFWEPNEQLNDQEKAFTEQQLDRLDWKVDVVVSHTCPKKYVPSEALLPGFQHFCIDSSTENWLGTIEKELNYRHWYCGHFHIDKDIDKVHFLFNRILPIPQKEDKS